MISKLWVIIVLTGIALSSCSPGKDSATIIIDNPTNIDRENESIELWFKQLDGTFSEKVEGLVITNENGKRLLTQLVDIDGDSIHDYLLFQTNIKASESVEFQIAKMNDLPKLPKSNKSTFCRFVPERIDDFAWENDRIAFRTYGPEGKRLIENGDPNGIISSGVDCWLKRVDYPIINKWYAKHQAGKSYHVDEGEGLDNYHVGNTRGCGGTAFKIQGKQISSENYTEWKVITNGPIRSIFELVHAPVNANEISVQEKKRYSIDLGSNFFQCDVSMNSSLAISKARAGITLHHGKGEIATSIEEGWFSYWESLDDSYLGTGIVVTKDLLGKGDEKEDNHLWANIKPKNNKYTYWAGFAWKKAGLYTSQKEWQEHLQSESMKRNNPLLVTIK